MRMSKFQRKDPSSIKNSCDLEDVIALTILSFSYAMILNKLFLYSYLIYTDNSWSRFISELFFQVKIGQKRQILHLA